MASMSNSARIADLQRQIGELQQQIVDAQQQAKHSQSAEQIWHIIEKREDRLTALLRQRMFPSVCTSQFLSSLTPCCFHFAPRLFLSPSAFSGA